MTWPFENDTGAIVKNHGKAADESDGDGQNQLHPLYKVFVLSNGGG